jgi:hypothetical protein
MEGMMEECDVCSFERSDVRVIYDWGRHVKITIHDIVAYPNVSIICGPQTYIKRPMRVCGGCMKTVTRNLGSAMLQHALKGLVGKEKVPECEICKKVDNQGYGEGKVEGYIHDTPIVAVSNRKYAMQFRYMHAWDRICVSCATIMLMQISEDLRENQLFFEQR